MAAKNEAKIRFSAETKDFDKGIKDANSTLNTLRNELKLNEAQMKANGTTVDGLRDKQKNLTAQMDAAQDKTKALSDKLAVAVDVFGENSVEANKLRSQLINAQVAEAKLQVAINNCNAELERQEEAARESESATEKLSSEIEDQEEELQKLKRAYADYVASGEKSSREAKALAREIDKLSGDLKENKEAMERAESAADKLDNTIEDAGESAQEAADGGFTVFKGALADLVSSGIQSAISGIGNLASSFLELSESTQEHRAAMSTLGASFDQAGHEFDYAIDTLWSLQGVLGDTDRAVEASNFLAKVSKDEEDLAENTRILTGVYALYKDSIPTEGLAEGIAATAEMSSVQGVLADALEWQGINLDNFNEQLEGMATSEERAAFVQQTLSDLYGEAADAYRENNADMIEANEAQLRYNDALAELGNKSQPITTGLKNGWAQVLSAVRNLVDGVDFAAIGESIEGAFTWFAHEGIPAIVQGVKDFIAWLGEAKAWITEYSGLLVGIAGAIGVVTAAIALQNTVNAVKAAMDAAQVTTIWGLVAAHWAQATAAMAALAPYILIVAAIAAVIAIIILCIKYWDEIVIAVQNAWEWIKQTLSVVGEWINTNVIQPVLEFFAGLWDGITSAFSAAWEWIKSTPIFQFYSELFQSIWNTISSVISVVVELFSGAWEIIKVVWGVVSGWFNTNIVQPISGFFSKLWTGVSETASNAWGKLKSGAQSAWTGIKSVFGSVASFFGDIFGKAWEGVKKIFSTGGKIFSGITDGITSAFKKVVNAIISGINRVVSIPFNAINKVLTKIRNASFLGITPFSGLGSISVPQIPLLAQGGILTQPTLNIAGEAGPEAVIPIDKLQSYISSAIDKTMQTVNINALVAAVEDLANRPIELNINGRQFAVATAADTDNVSGNRYALTKRGLAL